MKKAFHKFRDLYKEYKWWIDFLGTIGLLRWIQVSLPDGWKDWSISSSLAMPASAIAIGALVVFWQSYREQRKKISDLEWQLKVKNMTPEEIAGLMVKNVSFGIGVFESLFGNKKNPPNKALQTMTIADTSAAAHPPRQL